MLRAMALGMLILLSGCMVTDRADTFYTRSEINAINLELQCRTLARTIVQMMRCDVRR